MISLNKYAKKLVDQILEDPDRLGVEVHKMNCGVTLIDMGLHCRGSWQAALLFTRASIGDLGVVNLGRFKLNDQYSFASIEMHVEQPLIACMGSEIAGWKLGKGEYAMIGSGPARALAHVDSDWYFEMTDYKDECEHAVLCIQDARFPDDKIAMEIANACHTKPENTYLLFAPSTCIVGTMQVSARMLEQTCHKMFEKQFDAGQMIMVRGNAPIAPYVKDEDKTFGRINDALIYGSEVEAWVDAEDDAIEEVIDKLVGKTSSPVYGELFEKIFLEAGKDFFYIDHDVHSVGKIQIHNINTGRAFSAGEINYEALERSFLY
ncbi:MAG: methenyltetrahydromethanopterin cyclohydrolase [Clostridiales bacterium]|nr:methenyltetrahydromethanopterin cyclohydrolase [Clostridiales bacterium]